MLEKCQFGEASLSDSLPKSGRSCERMEESARVREAVGFIGLAAHFSLGK